MSFRSLLLATLMSLPLLANAHGESAALSGIAASPQEVRPLLLGSALPDVDLRTIEGEAVTLGAVVGNKPAIIVFYRGGWCPYCSLQLQGLRLIQEPLQALGYQMIAISPDSPESIRKTLDSTPLDYTLLSDSGTAAIRAFGLAFEVDSQTLEKYQGYGIDLEAASGQTHHLLPVPAVYLVDSDGTLQFSYVHPDYTARLPEKVILAAAESIHAHEQKIRDRQPAK